MENNGFDIVSARLGGGVMDNEDRIKAIQRTVSRPRLCGEDIRSAEDNEEDGMKAE